MLRDKVSSALSDILADGVDVHRAAAAHALGAVGDQTAQTALVKALLDEDSDVRTDAATALRSLAEPQTAAALMENLVGDPCSEVKLAAIAALVRLRHKPVIPWLKRLVVSRDEEIAWDDDEFYAGGWDDWLDMQVAAIEGLAELGVTDAVPALLTAYEDEMSQDLSAHVIAALLRLGGDGVQALEQLFADGDPQLRRSIAGALQDHAANTSLEPLLKRCLEDSDTHVRLAAITVLIQARPDDDRIAGFFSDTDPQIRTSVVEQIGTRHVDQVRACLDDPEPDVRRASLIVISRSPGLFDEDGLADIVRGAVSGSAHVAAEAAVAWATLDPEQALPVLGPALHDANQPLPFRQGVVRALDLIGPSALDPLAHAAGDAERQLRLDALTMLAEQARKADAWPNEAGDHLLAALAGELVAPPEEGDTPTDDDGEPSPGDVADDNDGESEVAEAVDMPTAAVELEGAKDPVPEADNGPVSTLQTILSGHDEIAPAQETPTEIELTIDDHKFLALAEQRAIRKKKVSPEPKVAPYQDVRRFAARLLGDIHTNELIPPLLAAAQEDDGELRHAALESLVQIGEGLGSLPAETFDVFNGLLAEKDIQLRMLAARALGYVDSPESVSLLKQLTDDGHAHMRLEAVRALDVRGDIDVGLVALLEDDDTGVRLATAKAMAAHCGVDAVEPLVSYAFFSNGMHRRQAGQILANVAPEQATLRFLEILSDRARAHEWIVAIEALAEIAPHLQTAPKQSAA